tara:strand:- start:365 stop:1270 length:906 start_codon:yes stop_codon:yes gene_type:complete
MYKLSVVVCTYKRENLLRMCLESLEKQTAIKADYEIVVVNNHSNELSENLIKEFKDQNNNIRFINEPIQGLSHARNRGWKESSGRYIAFIDDDSKAEKNWCKYIIECFYKIKPTPASVGGKILPWYDIDPPYWFNDRIETRSWGNEAGYLVPPRAKYGFNGSNMAFDQHVLELMGGFSTQYGMIGDELRLGEETELFMRLYKKHPKFWYDPQIIIYDYIPSPNMKLRYLLMRSYKSGQTLRKLVGCSYLSVTFFKSLMDLIYTLIKFPFRLIKKSEPFLAEIILFIIESGHYIGFLIGKNK